MTSYNPLVIEFQQWSALLRDLASARSLRAVLGYICMPPGWQPHGAGETTEAMRARAGFVAPAAQEAAAAPVSASKLAT